MKKLTASLFTSVDGVVGEPADWHFPFFCEELGQAVTAQMGEATTSLFGRKTYDSFAGAWPEREKAGEADAPMAKVIGDQRKIVVSRQKLTFDWRNSEQLQGELIEGVTALKAEGEGVIGMSGSISVLRTLLEARLVDELHLYVHPVAVRKGLRLFEDSAAPLPLKLLSCTPFKSGTIHLVYGPSEGPDVEQHPMAAAAAKEYGN